MKTIKISILALALGLMSFSTISKTEMKSSISIAASSISWKNVIIDVQEIPQNKPKSIDFEFKNTGKSIILITNVLGMVKKMSIGKYNATSMSLSS